MTRYHWPSWCRRHHRPHIRCRLCLTNRERRRMRRLFGDIDIAPAWIYDRATKTTRRIVGTDGERPETGE